MTNSNLVDFNARRNGGPPVIADTEDGYTRTANAIQDQLCKLDLSGSQFQLLNAIIRSTYGFNKKQDRVTNTYLADLTDLSDKAVRDGLQVLIDRHIIHCEKSGIMKLVSVNKVISEWVLKGTKTDSRRKAAVQMHQRSKCTAKTVQMHRANGANAPTPKTTYQRQLTKDKIPSRRQKAPTNPNVLALLLKTASNGVSRKTLIRLTLCCHTCRPRLANTTGLQTLPPGLTK